MHKSTYQSGGSIRALLIENYPEEGKVVFAQIEKFQSQISLERASNLAEGIAALKHDKHDVVLLDLNGSEKSGLQKLTRVLSEAPTTPIVVLVETDDKAITQEALDLGAQDYLDKKNLSSESIERAMRHAIDRKTAQNQIKESGAHFQVAQANLNLALRASQTGVYNWNLIDNTKTWDDQLLKIFGIEREEFDSSYEFYTEKIHVDDRERVNKAVQDCIDGKTSSLEVDYRIMLPDGTIRHVSDAGQPFFDNDGVPLRLTGVCRDITKNKVEEENGKRLALLEQRHEFIAMLVHDLRTPIIGSQRILSLMLQGALGDIPEQQAEVLSKICHSNESILLMINNLMESYKIDSGVELFVCKELDLDALIKSCVQELAPWARLSKIQLTESLGNPRPVTADHAAMRRVIFNLVSNSLKFTPENGTVEIITGDRNGVAILQVRDTGVGIEEADMKNIFQRFWQADNKYRGKGLGLGLYLSNQLVEAQKGTITCESKIGEGTTFEISLPYATTSKQQRVSVLVVDDSAVNQLVLKRFLELQSVEVDTASSGMQALEAVQSKKYAAIFMDLMMPGMDGFTTTVAMRKEGVDAPILAYSAHQFFEDDTTYSKAGFSDVVSKPITSFGLQALVRKWVDSSL